MVGLAILVVAAVVLYISYTAQNGLPWAADLQRQGRRARRRQADQERRRADRRRARRPGAEDRGGPAQGRRARRTRCSTCSSTDDVGAAAGDTTAEVRLGVGARRQVRRARPGHEPPDDPRGRRRCRWPTRAASVDIEDALEVFDPRGPQRAAAGDRRRSATRSPAAASDLNETIGTTRRDAARPAARAGHARRPRTPTCAGFVRGAAAATAALGAAWRPSSGRSSADARDDARRARRRRRRAGRERRSSSRRPPRAAQRALRTLRPGARRRRGDHARAAAGGRGCSARPRGA